MEGKIATSIQDEILDWLESARIPARVFAIINPLFSILESNREEHPLFLGLARTLMAKHHSVTAWLDGGTAHAVVSGKPSELSAFVAETIEKIGKGEQEFDSFADLLHSRDVKRSSPQKLTELFQTHVSLEQVLQSVQSTDLATVSIEQRQKLRQQLDDADALDAQELLGLKPGQRLTIKRMNRFLAKCEDSDMPDRMRQRVANLVRSFRNSSGNRLYLLRDSGEVECVLSIRFNAHIGHQQFRLRPVGGGSSVAERVRLPRLEFRSN